LIIRKTKDGLDRVIWLSSLWVGYFVVGWLVGWLLGWLVGWLVGWLHGCLFVWLIS
jgi:hypothetical protein